MKTRKISEETKEQWKKEYEEELKRLKQHEEEIKNQEPSYQCNLGKIYENRNFQTMGMKKYFSKERSDKKALELYKLSFDRGYSHAGFSCAEMFYKKGEYENYMRYLHEAGEQFSGSAIFRLIDIYSTGRDEKHSLAHKCTDQELKILARVHGNSLDSEKELKYWQKKFKEYTEKLLFMWMISNSH